MCIKNKLTAVENKHSSVKRGSDSNSMHSNKSQDDKFTGSSFRSNQMCYLHFQNQNMLFLQAAA